jgi:hypothetical protein
MGMASPKQAMRKTTGGSIPGAARNVLSHLSVSRPFRMVCGLKWGDYSRNQNY